MIIGFTGTRHGMTPAQQWSLEETLLNYGCTVLHHGDCVGADAQADALARSMQIARVVHPPLVNRYRAFVQPGPTCTVLEPRPYLTRNRAIVEAAALLIAAPQTLGEQRRSGTWAT